MPLTSKGKKILDAMERQYSSNKKAKQVFYASINSGKIRGAEGKADGGPVDRLPDHYADIGAPRIEDRRDSDPTLRAMGLIALKNRASGKQARNRMASDMGSAEIVDMMVPRGYADGGAMDSPYANVMPKSPAPHSGFIPGPTGGRTDAVPMKVQRGAYILPSDTLSAAGEGNSLAGADKINRLFAMGPYGSKVPKIKGRAPKTTKTIRQRFEDGGIVEPEHADILASDGELVIPPEKLIERFGSLELGHEAMDQFVVQMRKKAIKKLNTLPPPKRD